MFNVPSVFYTVLAFLALGSIASASPSHSSSQTHSSLAKRQSLDVFLPPACQDTCLFVVQVYTACLFPERGSPDGYTCRDACTSKGLRKITSCSECLAGSEGDSSSTLVDDLANVRAACGMASLNAAVVIKDTIPEPISSNSRMETKRIVIPDFSTIANMENLETTFMAAFPSSSALAPASTQAQPASSGLESTRAATAVALHQAKQSSYSTTNGAFSSFAPVSSLLLIALAISTFATLQ